MPTPDQIPHAPCHACQQVIATEEALEDGDEVLCPFCGVMLEVKIDEDRLRFEIAS